MFYNIFITEKTNTNYTDFYPPLQICKKYFQDSVKTVLSTICISTLMAEKKKKIVQLSSNVPHLKSRKTKDNLRNLFAV